MTVHRLRTTLVLALIAATVSFGLVGLLGESRDACTAVGSPDRSPHEGTHEDDSGTLAEAEEEVEANEEDGQRERLVGTTCLPSPRPSVDPRTCSGGDGEGIARQGQGRGEQEPRGPPARA